MTRKPQHVIPWGKHHLWRVYDERGAYSLTFELCLNNRGGRYGVRRGLVSGRKFARHGILFDIIAEKFFG